MRIGLRLLLGFFLVLGLALFVVLRVFVEEVKPGTRLAMEDSLVDTAYSLALLAAPDLKAGVIASGGFAQALNGLAKVRPQASLWGFGKTRIDTHIGITDARGIVVFDTREGAIGQDHSRWNDVYRTLRGEYGARSTAVSANDPDNTVMHVAAPILDGTRIMGVLTVSRPNQTLEPYIARSRQRILNASWVLLGVTLCIGGLFTWWMASSLQRLQAYASAVAGGERAQPPRMGRFSGNTEFSDLAQAVERMRVKLEDKAYVETYVHTLTHELKSPLAAIRGAAELLQEPLPESDRRRFATNIQRQTERLQHLIDQLLRLASVEQMRQLTDLEDLDLAGLTRELLQGLEPRLRGKAPPGGRRTARRRHRPRQPLPGDAGAAQPAGQRHRLLAQGRAAASGLEARRRLDGMVRHRPRTGCARLRAGPHLRTLLFPAAQRHAGPQLGPGPVPGAGGQRSAWWRGDGGERLRGQAAARRRISRRDGLQIQLALAGLGHRSLTADRWPLAAVRPRPTSRWLHTGCPAAARAFSRMGRSQPP